MKKKAHFSCSSSDYDEHADLSTETEDLADTDSEGSSQHLGIEPYQYEPYLRRGGLGKTEAAKAMAPLILDLVSMMALGPTRTTKALKGLVIKNG